MLDAGDLLPQFGLSIRTNVNVTNLFGHRLLTSYDGQTLEGQALHCVQAGRGTFFSVATYL